jgi:hypothetical protein
LRGSFREGLLYIQEQFKARRFLEFPDKPAIYMESKMAKNIAFIKKTFKKRLTRL